jgi:hypothetical protein
MTQAIKSICNLINSAILHSWSATARLVIVLLTLALAVWAGAGFTPWPTWF